MDVVYVEAPFAERWVEGGEAAASYDELFGRITECSFDERESVSFLAKLRKELRAVPDFEYRKSSYSNDDAAECVEIATNIPATIAIRDSKTPLRPPSASAPPPGRRSEPPSQRTEFANPPRRPSL
ncbi:DUF397 domain-containing protein [Streptomyces sp. NBC_00280]|uniref:DUF397 domain-containing protein n=1 Tax=Streptomyces sp. NBC_00280 TaxID=2975699 RepID=UPI00352D1D09